MDLSEGLLSAPYDLSEGLLSAPCILSEGLCVVSPDKVRICCLLPAFSAASGLLTNCFCRLPAAQLHSLMQVCCIDAGVLYGG